MSSVVDSYILQIMLYGINHLKAYIIEHYYFSRTKKPNRFEGQNMGGIKDMSSPPCQNMGGIYHPHPPQDLRPWLRYVFIVVLSKSTPISANKECYYYFHNIVAKLCTTDHQSCQEPETLSVGIFFQKKLLDLCEIS